MNKIINKAKIYGKELLELFIVHSMLTFII